jgi:hypothetical protein
MEEGVLLLILKILKFYVRNWYLNVHNSILGFSKYDFISNLMTVEDYKCYKVIKMIYFYLNIKDINIYNVFLRKFES